jgi:dTMP kinase
MNKINKEKQGHLISVEGIDGSGKSTICSLLYKYLIAQKKEVLLTKEPGGTELGKTIREILQHQTTPLDPIAEFLLFAADRAQHINTIIKPALQKSMWVVSDRMHDSSLAYQGYGRGLPLEKITMVNEWAMSPLTPDLTIYLRLDPEIAHERISLRNEKKTRFENEKKEFWTKITTGFEAIFKTHPCCIIVNANQTPEQIIDQIITHPLFVRLMNQGSHAATP